jgi:hypothetical protein
VRCVKIGRLFRLCGSREWRLPIFRHIAFVRVQADVDATR